MSGLLEKRLKECDKKIDELFQGVELNTEIENQLKALKAYYLKLYMDAIDDEAEKECIEIYELLIKGLEGAKSGQLKSEEVLKEIEEIKSLRKNGVVLENILTSLELLYWATLSGALFTSFICMAGPLVGVNPFFALALLSLVCMAAIYSTVSFFNCIDEFKSLAPVEEEFKREKNLVLFFKSAIPFSETSPSKVSGLDETQRIENLFPLVN